MKDFPQALILAAGRGNRLLPHTRERPKCLLEVGDRTILEHQLHALGLCGIETIEVITGHAAERVRETCGNRVRYAHNPAYDTTNSIDSLGCSGLTPEVDGLLVLNSDVLFHPELLARLIADPRENVLLADFDVEMGEEETKIEVDENDRIVAISKAIAPEDGDAENLGVLKLGKGAAERMFSLSRTRDRALGLAWVPDGVHQLRDEFEFHTLRIDGAPWIEIDYIHDLERARNAVYPQIHGALYEAGV